jgi:hypothetical protein
MELMPTTTLQRVDDLKASIIDQDYEAALISALDLVEKLRRVKNNQSIASLRKHYGIEENHQCYLFGIHTGLITDPYYVPLPPLKGWQEAALKLGFFIPVTIILYLLASTLTFPLVGILGIALGVLACFTPLLWCVVPALCSVICVATAAVSWYFRKFLYYLDEPSPEPDRPLWETLKIIWNDPLD